MRTPAPAKIAIRLRRMYFVTDAQQAELVGWLLAVPCTKLGEGEELAAARLAACPEPKAVLGCWLVGHLQSARA
jgi:hypothetical protein